MNDHLSIEDLSALLDDALPDAARARAHLAACAACRGELQALRETVALVRGAPQQPLPEGADLRLPAALLEATPQARPRDARQPSASVTPALPAKTEVRGPTRLWLPRLSLFAAGSLAAALVLAVGLRAGMRAGEGAAPLADESHWAVQQAPQAAPLERSAFTRDEAAEAEMMAEAEAGQGAVAGEGAVADVASGWDGELSLAAEDDAADDDGLDVETGGAAARDPGLARSSAVQENGANQEPAAMEASPASVDAAGDEIQAPTSRPVGLPASALVVLLGLGLAIAALLAWRSRG